MNEIFYNLSNPEAYTGIKPLHNKTKESIFKVKNWLSSQRTYTLHKPIKRKYPTRKYKAKFLNQFWEGDLIDVVKYAKENQGYKYILTIIDIYSRYGYALPLKNKKPKTVASAFETLDKYPIYFSSDEGNEFKGKPFADLMKSHNVKQFFRQAPFKAAVCERFNRTLKTRLEKYFTFNGNHKWIDALPLIVKGYNNSYHRTIKQTPKQATLPNAKVNHEKIVQPKRKSKFKTDDYVRVARYKGTFEKGYSVNWSEEVFIIDNVDTRAYPIMYEIKALDGELIKGKFYEAELQKVAKPEMFAIEKVLKRRNGKSLVKFRGYKNPEWVESINKISEM